MRLRSHSFRKLTLVLGLVAVMVGLLAGAAGATWSIVGVDPATGEVGVAVASCVPASALGDLEKPLVVVALAPGKGAGVSQAALNTSVPPEMSRLLEGQATAEEVVAAVTTSTFDAGASMRQHGVVTVDGLAVGFTGAENDAVALDRQAPSVTAQGNILVSEQVITDALDAFSAETEADLATRLVDALEAGSQAGGDSRCPGQTALFAHVVVASPGDDPQAPTVHLIATVDEGSAENPVDLLAAQFRQGIRQGQTLNADDSFPLVVLLLPLAAAVILGTFVGWAIRRRKQANAAATTR